MFFFMWEQVDLPWKDKHKPPAKEEFELFTLTRLEECSVQMHPLLLEKLARAVCLQSLIRNVTNTGRPQMSVSVEVR